MEFVSYEVKNRIGYITLNRPDKRNALNGQVVIALKEAFEVGENDPEAKVIVLRASGKAFCAGADLAYLQELQQNSYEENLEDSQHLKSLFLQIYTLGKIVIAQVQGHAIAGGCGLATVCDFAYSVPEAQFGYTEVKIGFIPAIVKVFLLRKIGEAHAKSLLLTGRLVDAQTAANMNLINEVVDAESLEKEVYTFAQELISNNSGQSMAITKLMIAGVQEKTLEDGLEYAAIMNARTRESEDCQKGIAAFLNKTSVKW